MMKKLVSIILSLTLALALMTFVGCGEGSKGSSTNSDPGFVYEKVTEDDTTYYVITGYNLTDEEADAIADGDYEKLLKDIVIPATHTEDGETAPVKEIEDGAFSGQLLFKTVTFEQVDGKYNIEKIGMGAFGGCTNLESMTLPFVGNSAEAVNNKKVFGYIFGTSEVSNATSTAQNYNEAGETNAVYLPNSLKTVTVDGQATIPAYAFNNVTTLETVTLKDAQKLSSSAFSGCTALTSMDLTGVTNIGEAAFRGCTSLMTVTMPDVTEIGQEAFRGCTSLGYGTITVNALDVPAATVYERAFYGCTSLRAVTLHCATVRAYTFYGCTVLESITFVGTTEIQTNAFFNCSALKEASLNLEGITVQPNAFDFNPSSDIDL